MREDMVALLQGLSEGINAVPIAGVHISAYEVGRWLGHRAGAIAGVHIS